MVTGKMPFVEAWNGDPHYCCLIEHQDDLFWKNHGGLDHLSDEIKDLIVGMLQYHPYQRYTLEHILQH
jgi:hypothetical protein